MGKASEEGTQEGDWTGSGTVIGVPTLEGKVGKFCFEKANKGKESKGVGEHPEGVTLGDAYFAMDDNQFARRVMNHQAEPVFVAVEGEESTLGPLMTDSPQHGYAVHFIECVFGINAKESKIIIGAMGLPELVSCMDSSLDSGGEAGA